LSIIFFVLLGIVSVKFAANFGVASREFRVIVIEPALLYGLIRASGLSRRDLWRLVDTSILSALAVSLIGLYQYFFTNWVIVGEGVRRVLAVYGSPNNLALFLDRALPLLIALALFVDDRRRRIAYALAAIPIALCLYLTYSRGSWLFALPAGLLFIGLVSGRRARIAIAALCVVAVIVLVPFLQTERAQSLFQTGTGTGFFRVSVWESSIAMIRDHPIFGVGLDNFLYEYPKYIKPDAWREPNLSHPHNSVLDFWLRLGILGVVVLVWMIVEFYRRGFRHLWELAGTERALVIGLMASMTAALAHGMIDAAYFYVDLAFVFMMTMGVIVELGD
jgi:O-antigen ligase